MHKYYNLGRLMSDKTFIIEHEYINLYFKDEDEDTIFQCEHCSELAEEIPVYLHDLKENNILGPIHNSCGMELYSLKEIIYNRIQEKEGLPNIDC